MVDISNVLSYYWNSVAEDKSMTALPKHVAVIASIQQMIEYLSYQRDYEGKMLMDTAEIVMQLREIISE